MLQDKLFLPFLAMLALCASAVVAQDEDQDSDDSKPVVSKPNKERASGKANAKSSDEEESEEQTQTAGIEIFAPRKMEMQFGMRFYANDNYCTNLHATIPFPLNWPEQRVTVTSSEIPPRVTWMFRDLPLNSKKNALARQLVMDIPSLRPNDRLDLLVNVEIEKAFINAPPDPSVFVIPKKLPKELGLFMGNSPYIEADLGEVKRIAKQIAAEKPSTAWEHVEKIYDWVRDNIEYQNGGIKRIREALKSKQGDCEEMTGIFVAICRASNIPARCVWIPEHCYPEFYLEDPQGNGHWFPCQVAGDRQFGQMHDYRPILQKGDRFKVAEENAMQRYVTHFFSCRPTPSRPQGVDASVEPVLDLGPLQDELDELRQQTDRPAEPE